MCVRRCAYPAATFISLVLAGVLGATDVHAAATCDRFVTANVVALDQPVMFNRLGASNVNGMVFALRRDVVDKATGAPEAAGGVLTAGNVALRPDKRPRPLILRVREGDCLTVNLQNLLAPVANPNDVNPPRFNVAMPGQVADRHVSFHAAGMQVVDSIASDGSYAGQNPSGVTDAGIDRGRTYTLYAEREGIFLARDMGTVIGAEDNQGNAGNLLFGAVIVEPRGTQSYRSAVTEEELRLASTDLDPASATCGQRRVAPSGHPIIDYEALYPAVNCPDIIATDLTVTPGVDLGATVWTAEGKAGLPVLNMMQAGEIVHSEIDAVNVGPNPDGSFPPSTYPLENVNKRNPSVPNRLEPFRDFASIFHEEAMAAQAFPGFFDPLFDPALNPAFDPAFPYVLEGVQDFFMINYGSGGIGAEIVANRLGVGPMHDCLTCAYEEFFLTSFAVGDPAQLTDVAANLGLETAVPGQAPPAGATGPKANYVPYPGDPANVHHSYTGDFVKIRNASVGMEQHVFHLHNHQWLFNANDDNANYLDAQGIGPGVGYTYEINFGGSGNRNKTAGDAIYHCHFYPHFAQGMWHHWRNHDVFESGTLLEASGSPAGFHTAPFALENGTPMLASIAGVAGAPADARVRSLPDGEVTAGAPIPAIVPLPGKPMAPTPGLVVTVPNDKVPMVQAGMGNAALPPGFNPAIDPPVLVPVGSLARVLERDRNPGYPFWIAGIEDTVGQRPPTPPLDMVTGAKAADLKASRQTVDGVEIFSDLAPAQADGWDGGLPRAALQGYAAGGHSLSVVHPLDFTKAIERARAVFYPEEGTDVEKVAMAYHAKKFHATYFPDGTNAGLDGISGGFRTNGAKPAIGAPYMEPCMDDRGIRLGAGVTGHFYSGSIPTATDNAMNIRGSSFFNADNPRVYKGVQVQYDAVFNKLGYHYPQQRIITLWQDAVPVITKQKPGEPLVMRFNTFDCGVYHHANLTPQYYEIDDYQVRTPTDIIGQHIHLPKWDLTTADGSANGWNYEDGTMAAGAVRERIGALNAFVAASGSHAVGEGSGVGFTVPAAFAAGTAAPAVHPYFGGAVADVQGNWLGARTTQQRWFFDPVVNTEGADRGLGIIFTHDHYGPSTHQQIGLYATVLTEPANSRWVQNETGQQLGRGPDGRGGRIDGGPTSWQAAILPQAQRPDTDVKAGPCVAGNAASVDGVSCLDPFREFYFEYSDFQHAYEAGVYIGADQRGVPTGTTVAGLADPNGAVGVRNTGNPQFAALGDNPADAFRFAINPPARMPPAPIFPDLALEIANTPAFVPDPLNPGLLIPNPFNFCPVRPCPQAIDVQDTGIFVVNYRSEPVGLRVFDPNKAGPDGILGTQAGGLNALGEFVNLDAGDLALAFQSRRDRAIDALNVQPAAGASIFGTRFPPSINASGDLGGGDPFTPMVRVNVGDVVRVKQQAGGDEEEHNSTIHGVKWLQGGSGHGRAPNSGWRNAQAGGISEQFTLRVPMVTAVNQQGPTVDHLYSMNTSMDGYWTGLWGIMRSYNQGRKDLFALPNGLKLPVQVNNSNQFAGICPVTAPVRAYDITAVLANDVLPNALGVTIPSNLGADPVNNPIPGDSDGDGVGDNVGGPLNPDGGTLVYNPRTDVVADPLTLATFRGPLHDPTAVLWFRTADLLTDPVTGKPVGLRPGTPIEPLILRAGAGECIDVTLRNRLLDPAVLAADGTTAVVDAAGRPVYADKGEALFVLDPNNVTSTCGGQPCTQVAAAAVAFDGMPALPTTELMRGAVKRDRLGVVGATTFQANLIRASALVGLHPQLVAYDISRADGAVVGNNNRSELVAPGDEPLTVRWYAGDVSPHVVQGKKQAVLNLVATPVELGGASLQPADKFRQGMASLVGQLVVEPAGSTWTEDGVTDNPDGTFTYAAAATRTQATVTSAPAPFRDFSVVWAKGLNQYYADSSPVGHVGLFVPEAPPYGTHAAVNFRAEPLWFRAGIVPDSPIEVYALVDPQFDLYSNTRQRPLGSPVLGPIGEPATPVFTAAAGMPFRMRLSQPHGINRGSTFALHGHVWQRDPYVCTNTPGDPGSGLKVKDSLAGRCGVGEVGSTAIGLNPIGFFMGGQESVWPSNHYDLVFPSAGGAFGVPGDYLYRDVGAFGNAGGLWGILRVQ